MKLLIFAGRGKNYGTGHKTRMRDLETLLRSASLGSPAPFHPQSQVSRNLAESLQKFVRQAKAETIFRAFKTTEDAFQDLAKINASKDRASFLFLLDMRELDPYPFLEKGSVLTLDNYHSTRYTPLSQLAQLETRWKTNMEKAPPNRLCFHDTLAHPSFHSERFSHSQKKTGKLEALLKQALISPYLLDRKKKEGTAIRKKALVCAGPFEELPDLFSLFSKLMPIEKAKEQGRKASKSKAGKASQLGYLEEILWLGKKSKDKALWPFLSFQKRISRTEFWDHIREAQMFFCYPGMALLEAWFLGKRPILFSTESKTHNDLSAYLEGEAKFPYLKKQDGKHQEFLKAYRKAQAFLNGELASGQGKTPSGEGYSILLQKLRSL